MCLSDFSKRRKSLLSTLLFIVKFRRQAQRISQRNGRYTSARRAARAANRHADREFGLRQMTEMSDYEFQRHFRMTRRGFNELLGLVAIDITVNEDMASRSSGSSVSATTRIAVTLRWLAGGSYLDIARLYGISELNFFNQKHGILWKTIAAIDRRLQLGFSVDPEKLERTALEFSNYSHGRMTHCVMAIDGWVMKTRQPTPAEVGNCVSSYRNRKNCWGIVVMAGCDANLRFTLFSANSSGSTHDSVALEFTQFKQLLDNGILPPQYYIIGDEAFSNSQQLLVPWSGTGIGDWKDSFNYHLSSMRQCIERAFGLLTKRWGIFWRPLSCQFNKWATVATVCAKLHNFCVDRNIAITARAPCDNQPLDEWVVLDNDSSTEGVDYVVRPRPTGDRRRLITAMLENDGIRRPHYAQVNSRAN